MNGTLGTPVIRGLTQVNLSSPDRNVAIFYGGIYLSNSNASNLDILDLERIEVVKGPQSALYGRNAFGGAINYVPARARQDFAARAEGTVGSNDRYEIRGTIAGGLTETLAARLSAGDREYDGAFHNLGDPGDKLQGFETTSASWDLRWTPTDAFEAGLFGFYSDDDLEPGASFMIANNCGRSAAGAPTFFCGELPTRATASISPQALGIQRENWLVGLDAQLDFGPVVLASQTGYSRVETDSLGDYDFDAAGTTYDIVTLASVFAATPPMGSIFTGLALAPTVRRQNLQTYNSGFAIGETEDWSQELRLQSRDDTRLRWLVGAFYYRHENTLKLRAGFDSTGLAPGEIPRSALAFTAGILQPAANIGNLPFVAALERPDRQRAAFGSLDFDFTEQWTLGVELRRDREDREQRNLLTPAAAPQKRRFQYTTWRANLDWEPTDDHLLYVSAAEGVISGYFNQTTDAAAGGLPVPFDLQAYDPSTNRTYEVGAKSLWLDRRLSTELAIYHIDYEDLQVNSIPPAPLVTNLILNVAGAHATGAELGLAFRATDRLELGAALAYVDPKYDGGVIDLGATNFCGTDNSLCRFVTVNNVRRPVVGGNQLPRSSKEQASVNATYGAPLGSDWSFYLRGDANYQSKQFSRSIGLQYAPDRTLVNARVGFQRGENLEIALWSRNLLDEEYAVAAIAQPPLFLGAPFLTQIIQGEPRSYGLTLRYAFGP